jgi:hypothetical protein
MSLHIGSWSINANGFEGELKVTAIDAQGNLSGTGFDNEILGFWDETSQKITFMRLEDPSNPSTFQIYTGYQFSNPLPDQDGLIHTLAGSFEGFKGTGGTAQRSVIGWFARVTVPSVLK